MAVVSRLGLSALLPMGCASNASRPIVQFPDRHELEHIAATPAKVSVHPVGEVPADGWTLEFAPSSPGAASTPADAAPSNPLVAEVAKVASQSAGHPKWSAALACVAREAGRFYLRQGAQVPEDLSRFTAGACGVLVPNFGVGFVGGAIPDGMTEEQVLRGWQPKISEFVRSTIPSDTTEAAAWFGRSGGKGFLSIAFAKSIARMTTTDFRPDAHGDVALEGQITEPFDHVMGYANRGSFGVDACFMDPSVRRPRFRAVCRLSPQDPSTWVQMVYVSPGRVLGTPFLQVLVRPNPATPLTYREEKVGPPRPVTAPAQFTAAVLEGLNAVRKQVGYKPVRIAAEQSKTAAQVAGPFFDSALKAGSTDIPDRIALGLMAGWQVGGIIREGGFVSSIVPRTRDASRWLAATLAMPIGRATLLAPEIEALALGPIVLSNPDALGAVASGYRLYGAQDHSSDIDLLYSRILRARRALSLPEPARLAGMDKLLRQELARVQRGEAEPMDTLNVALSAGVSRFGAGMRGVVMEATAIEAVEIPDEIIRARRLFLEIGVSHHKPEGAAWGQLVIVIVYTDPRELRASHAPPHERQIATTAGGTIPVQ